jgi:hypothetical protein
MQKTLLSSAKYQDKIEYSLNKRRKLSLAKLLKQNSQHNYFQIYKKHLP